MTLRRFYCENIPVSAAPSAPTSRALDSGSDSVHTSGAASGGAFGGGGGRVILDREQAEHARKSLRLSVGDRIELFDGRGLTASAVIIELHRTLVAAVESHHTAPPLVPALTLAVAIPKGSRADTLVEQATQLGVTHLVPLITQRSVVEPRDKKIDRFHRIMIEACKQSHRPHFMTIADPTPLSRVLQTANEHEVRLIADVPTKPRPLVAGNTACACLSNDSTHSPAPMPGGSHGFVHEVQTLHPPAFAGELHTTLRDARRVLVLVGPEGGWTDDERLAAQQAGFHAFCFAPYILRVETAALAAAAIIRQSL